MRLLRTTTFLSLTHCTSFGINQSIFSKHYHGQLDQTAKPTAENPIWNAVAQVLFTEYVYLNKNYAHSSSGDFKLWVVSPSLNDRFK